MKVSAKKNKQMPKSVIILRGLPGSGKSIFAKERVSQIRENGYSAEIHSADNFFTNENGEYNFIGEKIGEAHATCFSQVENAFKNDIDYVILDNTNIQLWNFANYIRLAEKYGYSIEVRRFNTNIETSVSRNIHGVPQSTIEKMAQSFEPFNGEKCQVFLSN
jgi:predicted kinase